MCKIYWYNLPQKIKEIILFSLELEIDQDQEDALNELFASVQWFNVPESVQKLGRTMLSCDGPCFDNIYWFNSVSKLKSICEQINQL